MTEPDNVWATFFAHHASVYDQNVFTQNTAAEVEFLLEELALAPGARILDLGCGTGRHAVALALRGFAVTGLDLSPAMLQVARARAEEVGAEVTWIQGDAAALACAEPFDAVLGLCEGGLGLLDRDDDPIEQPLAILRRVFEGLKPGARCVFTVLSATRMIRAFGAEDQAAGRFDFQTLVEQGSFAPREGAPEVPTRERAFVATELRLLFRLAGFTVEHVWGGTAGNWGRRPLDPDEYELMIVARRP
ncbi:MAG: methyltransferase domain-containing protein [Planctomycetota bacterium]